MSFWLGLICLGTGWMLASPGSPYLWFLFFGVAFTAASPVAEFVARRIGKKQEN